MLKLNFHVTEPANFELRPRSYAGRASNIVLPLAPIPVFSVVQMQIYDVPANKARFDTGLRWPKVTSAGTGEEIVELAALSIQRWLQLFREWLIAFVCGES
jgi:hypothetical protein